MILVDTIPAENWESKRDLMTKLQKEAPDFLGELMKLELPQSPDRLNVPIISTEDKEITQKHNQTALEQFIDENCFYVPGRMLKFSEFYDAFIKWCDSAEAFNWSKIAVGRSLPRQFVKGRSNKDAQFYIGNISFEPKKPEERDMPELVLRKDFLVYKTE